MPLPKLQLQVPVNESQSLNESQQLQASINLNGSLRANQDEVTVLTRSYNPYNFTREGFTSKGTNGAQHYKISEKDIWIIRRQGAGASSTVFKGFHFRENRFVAVKKINVLDRETRHQMLNDVKALCDARAVPGLIAFAGAFHMPDSGQIAIVLEYMDGGSLQDMLEKVGSIPEDILSLITAKILVGLTYLHRQKHMVHRDIKPGNILVNSDGDPKITDFGISAFIDSTLAVCNTFLGTVTYMSPERINNEQYSFSADIWSLGLVLIECATGKYPYDASVGPLQLMIQVLNDDLPVPEGPDWSPAFKDFVSQCMRKNPHERPTAEQLLQHPFITKHTTSAPPGALKDFMRRVFDPHDKLDEITIVFTWNYYALLSGGPTQLQALAPLYSDASVLVYDGMQCTGREAIMGHLAAAATANAMRRLQKHEVKSVDCQPLGLDGSALVHVAGVQVPDTPAGGEAPVPFTETFILCQVQPGEYYVANQMHRTLAS